MAQIKNPASIKEELLGYAAEVEAFLGACLKHKGIPDTLTAAMEYSLLAGGKRLRPVLCLMWAEVCGLERAKAMPFAAALECIHTYSLIHDDLPALDNDDLRRGKPSNHKQFDEATAILAGDGLLTESFGFMADAASRIPADRVLCAISAAAKAAGAAGMVGGQLLDMEYTGREDVGIDELRRMHAMKTGALIRVSCASGALLAGADADLLDRASIYGGAVGTAFQIVDDILDVVGDTATLGKPAGSDQEAGKNTYPSLLGLDESRRLAEEYVAAATGVLDGFDSPEADFLRRLARYIVDRVS